MAQATAILAGDIKAMAGAFSEEDGSESSYFTDDSDEGAEGGEPNDDAQPLLGPDAAASATSETAHTPTTHGDSTAASHVAITVSPSES